MEEHFVFHFPVTSSVILNLRSSIPILLVLVVIVSRRVPSPFERSPRVQSGSFSIRYFVHPVSLFGLVPSNITDRGYC
ncbi:hypothetical protein TNCV_3879881 [Trichonephila clavipes]|nr:hypothetical protein TNCV_3879881 [Trichonephila clavipes]